MRGLTQFWKGYMEYIIDKNIEAIIIEIISKFDSQPLHKNVADNGTGIFIKKDNTRNKDAKEKEGGNNTENLIFILIEITQF